LYFIRKSFYFLNDHDFQAMLKKPSKIAIRIFYECRTTGKRRKEDDE